MADELSVAAAAAGLQEDEALEALDHLGGLVRETVPRHYTFRHPDVQQAVYEHAGLGWRLQAHARAAAALSTPQQQAPHLEHCAKPGDEAAIATLIEAAQSEPEQAARWYAAAQRLGADQRRPLAHALANAGKLEQALDQLPPSDTATAATWEHLTGRYASAHARVRRLPEHDVALLLDAVYAPDYVALKTRAKRAVHVDPDSAVAWALLAIAHAAHGELSTAEEALDEATALHDPEAAYYLGFAAYMCERDEEAIAHLRAPSGPFAQPMLVALAHALERQGRLHEAREAAEQALDGDNAQMRSWALAELAYIETVMGERPLEMVEEAAAIAARLDTSFFTIAAHAMAAATFLLLGEPARCLEQARRAGTKLDHGRRAQLLVVEACAGRAPAELLTQARALVARSPLQVPRGIVGNVLARITGDVTHAAVDSPFPLIRAEAHLIRGLALGEAQDLTQAQAVPGAARLHDEAARALRKLGKPAPGRQRRFGRGELSGREREIADLVSDGLTNKEIAGRLYLSEKTIEGHLSNIFAKFGVSSRAAVAARHASAA